MTFVPKAEQFRTDVDELLAAIGRGFRPPSVVSAVEWGPKHFVVPVGPAKGHKLNLALTPYVAEILECLRVDSPHVRVSVKKSAQTGLSTMGFVWLLSLIDTAPDDMMYVMPTLAAAKDLNRERFDDIIKSCAPVAKKVRPQRSRAGDGSTTLTKVFPGGRLILTGANSATDLSSKVVRFAVADEVDRWPLDVDGQGSPMKMLDERQTSFTRTATHKKLEVSTPANAGSSVIDKCYEAGDQRIWVMPCPHCGAEIDFRFEHLEFERLAPYNARYVAQCCERKIESWQQRKTVLAGRWKATKTGPGRHPSFFLNALSSLLTSWDTIAAKYWDSRGIVEEEKVFTNTVLGLSFEEHGQDLDAAKIAAAAEDYPRNAVPATVGRLVLAVDTQDDRLEWAVYGFGPSPTGITVEQWLIGAGVIEGDTSLDEPWEAVDRLAVQSWPHGAGKVLPVDIVGIDSGGHRTGKVYRFVKGKPKYRALRGFGEPERLPLGTPARKDVKDQYKRVLFKVPLYPVGVYGLKLWLAHALKAIETGQEAPGRLHLTGEIADEAYVRQLAAERLVARERRDGRVVREWHPIMGQRNEALDLAVYARALAFGARPNGLGVDRITREQWSAILAERHGSDPAQGSLFGMVPEVRQSAVGSGQSGEVEAGGSALSTAKPERPRRPVGGAGSAARRLNG